MHLKTLTQLSIVINLIFEELHVESKCREPLVVVAAEDPKCAIPSLSRKNAMEFCTVHATNPHSATWVGVHLTLVLLQSAQYISLKLLAGRVVSFKSCTSGRRLRRSLGMEGNRRVEVIGGAGEEALLSHSSTHEYVWKPASSDLNQNGYIVGSTQRGQRACQSSGMSPLTCCHL